MEAPVEKANWYRYVLATLALLFIVGALLGYRLSIETPSSPSNNSSNQNSSTNETTVFAADTDFIKHEEPNVVWSTMIVDGQVQAADLSDAAVTTIKLANSSITAAKIAAGSIRSEHIADGAVLTAHIGDSAVITGKIANGAVTDVKLASGSISLNKLSAAMCANSETLVKLAGVWTCSPIAPIIAVGNGLSTNTTAGTQTLTVATDNSTIGIVSNNIALLDNAVTGAKLANGSVTVSKIVDGSIENGKLAASAITTDKIANGTILFEDLASNSCSSGEILKFNGTSWICGNDNSAGSPDESEIESLIFDGDNTGTLSSGTLDLSTLGFSGTLSDTNVSDALTISSAGSVANGALSAQVSLLGSSINLGSEVSGQLPLSSGGTGANLTAPSSNKLLFWNNTGTSVDWLTLGSNLSISGTTLNAADQFTGTVTSVGGGNGLTGGPITASGTLAINSPTCSGTDKLQWNGTAFICSADIDTDTNSGGTVTSVGSGNGLTGTVTTTGSLAVSAPTCSGTTKLQWNGTAFICSADVDTQPSEASIESMIFDGDNTGTLSSGTLDFGTLSFSGTLSDTNISDALTISSAGSISNGALSASVSLLGSSIDLTSEVTGQLPLSSGGTGANLTAPTSNKILFWNNSGTATDWLALGTNLSISGTTLNATDQYTGTVTSVGSGNGLTGTVTTTGSLAVNSPTCSGTDKLRWTGTAFLCATDVDTNSGGTVTSITSGNGLTGSVTTTGSLAISAPTCSGTDKLQWNGTAFICSADVDTTSSESTVEGMIFDGDNTGTLSSGTLNLSTLSFSGTLSDTNIADNLTISSGGSVSNGALSASVSLLGSSIDLASEVSGQLSLSSGGTGANLTAPTSNKILFWNNGSTSTDWLTLGSNLAISGTTLNATDQYVGTVTSVGSGNGLTGTVTTSGSLAISSPTCSGTDKLQWTGTAFICSTDVDTDTNSGGTVTSVSSGNGLTGTVTTTGSLAISSPTCSGTDKLRWTGTAFLCATDVDTNSGGTVTSITSGNGLTGSVTTTGSLAVSSPTCSGTDKLRWTGTAFLCATDVDTTYTAGNDLDLNSGAFDIESQLDSVSTISRASSDLTLQTTTSGNILLSPADNVAIGGSAVGGIKLNVAGTVRMTGFQLGTSATSGKALITDSSGVGTWQTLPVGTVYQLTTSKTGVKIWTGSATTTSGVATFNLTDDGTGSGNALFTNIYTTNATASANTATVLSIPLASIKLIAANKKTVTVNVIDGLNVPAALGGPPLELSADGTTAYLTVIGD